MTADHTEPAGTGYSPTMGAPAPQTGYSPTMGAPAPQTGYSPTMGGPAPQTGYSPSFGAQPMTMPPAPPAAPYGWTTAGRTIPFGTNGMAIASMVLGIVWIYWLGSLLAVIFGHIALHQLKQRERIGAPQNGKGMAVAGLVLGYIGLAIFAVFVVLVAVAAGTSGTSTA